MNNAEKQGASLQAETLLHARPWQASAGKADREPAHSVIVYTNRHTPLQLKLVTARQRSAIAEKLYTKGDDSAVKDRANDHRRRNS